ncbi:MAG: TatD family hydrolase [Clostridiales bacterium]|jgi:TatD DNase family protein|nr:TatD family hydrolase [Clostridiales bacterium]
MLFDTHAHLVDKVFDEDRKEVIKKSYEKDKVTNIINVGTDLNSSKQCVELAERYDFLFSSVGIHPIHTKEAKINDAEKIKILAQHKKNVAIGEIGLDYHYKDFDEKQQKKWFEKQLKVAKRLNIPVIVHDRDSNFECINIIESLKIKKGVFHCFNGDEKIAQKIIEMGFHLSFTGIVTYKNAKNLIQVIRSIPNDKILIETDCPYLSPEPHRGKRNYPGNVKHIAEKIANIKNTTFEEIADITNKNAKKLFLNKI